MQVSPEGVETDQKGSTKVSPRVFVKRVLPGFHRELLSKASTRVPLRVFIKGFHLRFHQGFIIVSIETIGGSS